VRRICWLECDSEELKRAGQTHFSIIYLGKAAPHVSISIVCPSIWKREFLKGRSTFDRISIKIDLIKE
jgi:hypothetical protein